MISGGGDIVECIQQRPVEIKDGGVKRHFYREQLPSLVPVTDQVNDQRARQDQHIVFPGGNVHSVSVCPGNPPLRYSGDGLGATSESVFHIQKAAFSLQIFRTRNIHRESTTEQGEQVLLHDCTKHAIAVDLVSRSPGQ